ncbi:MAG TPA: glycosyltransferase family 1 protein [Gaiellaceae bacterium]|nr:glycosyltransferase family 1 protein [Gaiellaceae bacterium]
MRVGLDVSPLSQTQAGTARYIRGLLAHNEYEQLAFAGQNRLRTIARDALWYPLMLPRAARKRNLDVLHCPTFRGPFRSGTPVVVTVLDLAVLRHPGTFNQWTRRYSRLAVPRVVQTARLVIAISEFTRSELVELLRVPAEKIRVIPVAIGASFTAEGSRAEGDYVLAVGTLEPRKNLAVAQQAAQRLAVPLKVVGARGWGGVAVNGWLGRVSDDELAALYRGARCLVYPSLYEGFGIPILEAMACGTPVVTSAGGATEEVAGGAAVLVDPRDPAAVAAGIEQAVSRRDELVPRGLERARGFTWERVAAETWRVYEEAAA